MRKHGHTSGGKESPEYVSWKAMKTRCLNPKDKGFKNYGGRGIAICDRWRNSFENFFADIGKKPHGTTLHRVDNKRNYEPGNCVWATWKVQNNNRRRNGLAKSVVVDGRYFESAAAVASAHQVNEYSLRKRMRRLNETPEQAIAAMRTNARNKNARLASQGLSNGANKQENSRSLRENS